jgi:hypothetical protein
VVLLRRRVIDMPTFRRIVQQGYTEILDRDADPGGLQAWDNALQGGMTEAAFREALIRSEEFANNNPGGGEGPPDPPPTGPGVAPLSVSGGKFRDPQNNVVKFLGFVVAGDDPGTPSHDEGLVLGWPFVNAEGLHLIHRHQLNYTVFRLGPNIDREVFGAGEGPEFCGYALVNGKYDLNSWDEDFWTMLRNRLVLANSLGIYVCLSLIDSWNLDHDQTPWNGSRNRQGFEGGSLAIVRHAPHEHAIKWVQKIAQTVKDLPNVLVIDGNESFKGNPQKPYIHGLRDAFKAVAPNTLFGTNSGITEDVDFLCLHDITIPDAHPSLPTIVDEYPTRPMKPVIYDAQTGFAEGRVHYIYWKGEHSDLQRDSVLRALQEIRNGGTPIVLPESFPTLTKMGIVPHTWLDPNHQQTSGPVRNGWVNIDLTQKFGAPPKPCNDEKNDRCGGFNAEDTRGGVWELVESPGGVPTRVENGGFLFKVGRMPPGFYRVRCSPHPDSRDPYGRPHRVAPDAAQEMTWVVG